MLLQPLPFLRLRGEHEIHHIARNETQPKVILFRFPLAVPTRHRLAVLRHLLLCSIRIPCTRIRPECQQPAFDCRLETPLGNLYGHVTSSRTSILPVTAAETRVARSSLRLEIASRTLSISTSILTVSRSRKAAMSSCSRRGGIGVD